MMHTLVTRLRIRQLGVESATSPPASNNAITDVPGVWVGHSTVIRDVARRWPAPG